MRWLCSSAVLIAILAAGCGESTVPGEPAQDEITTSTESTETPASTTTDQPPPPTPTATGGGKKQQKPAPPPGVPGSPVAYDSSRTGLKPLAAKEDVEGQLAAKCEKNRCGIKVVITGGHDCTASISPNPVHPNKTVTILTRDCDSSGSSSSSSTTTTSRK